MPEINKIPEVLYNGNQPYHVHYDNLPLKNILARIDLVNSQVDINSDILRGCSGTMGNLSTRLSVSIKDDGHLKTSSVDSANHSIGAHSDGPYLDLETNSVISYVRMRKDERDKLNLIASEATNFRVEIEDSITSMSAISQIPSIIPFSEGTLRFNSSDTIFFDFEAPSVIKAHSVFPKAAAHKNIHGVIPEENNPTSPDHKTFNVQIPFLEDTLRVYINGFRINFGAENAVRVLIGSNPALTASWKSFYIEDITPASGIFKLNTAISYDTNLNRTDVLIADFDVDYSI